VVAEDPAGAEQLADRPLDGQVEQGRGEVRLQWSRLASWARTTVASAGARTGWPNPGSRPAAGPPATRPAPGGALELFEARGFERTTVDQIAASADISRRTFFRYFADKEELFFAEDERLLEVIGETWTGLRPASRCWNWPAGRPAPWPPTAPPNPSGAWPGSG
jgi:hypothetical protein